MRVPRGGASCLGVGRPGLGALPPPTARPLGGLPGPTTHWLWVRGGAGVGTHHLPHSARSCELALRAVGAARGCPGGAPPAWVWGVRGPALSHPRLPALWAGCRSPLPTGCGCGGVRAWGPVTNPTARALACCGGGMRVPGGGASCLGVGRPGSGALPAPTARPLGGLPGPTTHWLWVRGGCGRGGTSPTPQRALLRAGFARCGGGTRAPGGGASCLGVGRSGSGALPPPTARPLGGLPGPTTHWLWVRGGCGRGGTSPTPQRALLRAGFARCGGGTRAPGGGASCLGVGRPGWGALPPPTARPLGGLPGPTTHWLWVRGGCGRGGTSPTPQRALLRAGFARCGGGTRAPGGGASCLGVGRSGSGALPPPTARPLGGLPGPTTHWLLVRGGCGRGGTSPTPQRAPLQAGFARSAGGMRVPGGVPLAWVWGVRGRALSHPRLPALWAGCRGSLPTGRGCGGVRAWGPVTNPTAGTLGSWLCALWGRHEGAAPTARPLGGLPGPTTHWPWVRVRGVAGVGTRHQPHSARSCELALRAVGAARGRPGGAPPAWVWGVRGRALSSPRLPALWAGCRGPLPTGCGCRGVRAWGPVTNSTARALASWLCTLWGRHEGARGRAPPA